MRLQQHLFKPVRRACIETGENGLEHVSSKGVRAGHAHALRLDQ